MSLYDLETLSLTQAGKATVVNNNDSYLEVVFSSVLSRTLTTAPGSPSELDAYIVAPVGATTPWDGQENNFALYLNANWEFIAPSTRFPPLRVLDETNVLTQYDGAAWLTYGLQPKINFAATAAPTVTDDNTQGYSVGSFWYDITNDLAYVCLDASTSAAVWKLIG